MNAMAQTMAKKSKTSLLRHGWIQALRYCLKDLVLSPLSFLSCLLHFETPKGQGGPSSYLPIIFSGSVSGGLSPQKFES